MLISGPPPIPRLRAACERFRRGYPIRKMKILPLILFLTTAVSAHGEMVRAVEIRDARTLVIERNGAREDIRLAGVAITDAARAAQLLQWTVANSWVLVEPHPAGDHLVWRSPDALFVNRELVSRGYARATLHGIEVEPNVIVTYLGELNPPAISRPPRKGSDTSRRSSAARSPKTRSAPALRSGGRASRTSPRKPSAARTRAQSPRQ